MAVDSLVTMRAFLALPLAACFQEEILPLINLLKDKYPQVRWVSPKEIHVTLHFFGSVPESEKEKISAIVSPITAHWKPMELFLEGLGAFPHLEKPRVIWLGLKGEAEALKKLQKAIEEGLRREGYPSEEREFRPHLTIGRVKEKGGIQLRIMENLEATRKCVAREIVLFQSHLTPEGAHYEAVATFPLSAS